MPIQTPPLSAEVFGQGIKYPPQLDGKGRLALSWGLNSVDEAVRSICVTQPSERVMNPSYGAATETFEPFDLPGLEAAIQVNIADHEPRVEEATVEVTPQSNGTSLAKVVYRPIGSANERTLTFPLFAAPSSTGPSE